MRLEHSVPAAFAALAFAFALGGCLPNALDYTQGNGGKSGAAGAAGAQGGSSGPAGSGGGNVGTGGSGGATGSGGSTGGAGTSGSAGTSGAGGSTGAGGFMAAGGATGSGGAAGTGGAGGLAGATGTGGAGQAGRGGTGAGGTVAGRGGGPGAGGLGGSGGAAGSGGSGTAMRSPGCGKVPTLTSGSRTIQSSGENRSYILRIPDNYDNSHAYHLIFAYHWNGGTMQDIDGGGSSGDTWSYYGLKAQANNSTIFVAPQGISNGWGNSGGQDLKLTDDMIKLIEGDLCVDTTQVFALGFSYGGSMSYALACARPTVFRAVAVFSGGVLSGCDGGTLPVAYIGIHGISDGTLNISGGRTMRDRFVMNNGCTAQNPPEPTAGT